MNTKLHVYIICILYTLHRTIRRIWIQRTFIITLEVVITVSLNSCNIDMDIEAKSLHPLYVVLNRIKY